MAKLPEKVLGCYWPYWNGPVLTTIPDTYNTIYLFSGRPVGGQPGTSGAIFFEQNRESPAQFKIEVSYLRSLGKSIILSVGGAGEYIRLDTQTRSQAFVDSVKQIYESLGGFDGIDFDIESDSMWPGQIVWIAQQLKSIFGSSFAITYPPAPWRFIDRTITSELYKAGVLDFVAPQYYGLTGLNTDTDKINHIVNNISSIWMPIVGNDASKIGVGYGIASTVSETLSLSSFTTAWKTLVSKYPSLRGTYSWEAAADSQQNYLFASTLAPLINSTSEEPVPSPIPSPSVPSTTIKVTINTHVHKIDGINIRRGTNNLVIYTPDKYAKSPANQYGAEAVVQGGKVTKLIDGVVGTIIPSDGYLLSGHGTSRQWLLAYAKIGNNITLS